MPEKEGKNHGGGKAVKKRLTAVVLSAVIALSVCACGGGAKPAETTKTVESTETILEETALSKEELLNIAKKVDAIDINNDTFDNVVSAKQKYCNTVLMINGVVRSIAEDHIEFGGQYTDHLIDVYLPLDEIAELKTKQAINVVGETSDEVIKVSQNYSPYTADVYHYQMPHAYLAKDRYEVKGVVQTAGIKIYSSKGELLDGIKSVHWAEGVDKKKYEWQDVVISAKIIYENDQPVYYDAYIVE